MMVYLKSALRHLWKNKLFSFINIAGLALGLACCFVILLHVKFELGYDRYQNKADRIVRVLENNYSFTPIVLGTVMQDYFPEIDKIVRLGKADGNGLYVIKNNEFVQDKNLVYADSTFFSIFSNPIVTGDPATILRSPDKITISESMAYKYYGTGNPSGNVLSLRLSNTNYNFTIEGIFKDFPEQSHFHANFIVSWAFFKTLLGPAASTNWTATSVHTYLLMKQPGMTDAVTKRLPGFVDKYVDKDIAKDIHLALQPLKKIHLHSKETTIDIEPQGSINQVIIFTSVAILILVIAIVNFVMLSLAMSFKRIKQFGIRKIVGAQQRDQVLLVSAEFFIVFVLAVQIAFMLVELTIPILDARMGMKIYEGVFANSGILLLFISIVFLLGYWASLYITLSVSHIRPIDALKNVLPSRYWWMPSRGSLVIFQFFIMIGLLVSLMVMQKQLWLVRNTDLGYKKEQLVNISIPFNSGNKYQLFKEELKSMPGVVKVSGAAYIPPSGQWWIANMKNPDTGETFQVEEINADYDLIETMGIKMIQGRSFSRNFGSDSMAIMINESAAKLYKMKDPLETSLIRDDNSTPQTSKQIIGVFRDFNSRSLYEKAQPMIVFLSPRMVQQMAVKLASGDIKSTIHKIEDKWTTVFPDDPIQYSFVDEALRQNYQKDDQAQALITLFTILSLIIALLGLFGLSTFTLERRIKESGIRKVIGAQVVDIFFVLSRQFITWVAISFIIAVPASWYAMHHWLNHFAYRTDISWWIFAAALLISVVVAGITICWQTYKAATKNPVDALRYE